MTQNLYFFNGFGQKIEIFPFLNENLHREKEF